MAQSNVTIYGVVDAGFAWGKADDNRFTGINSGLRAGSRLGFRGAEDLGNGLKAVFTLEYGLSNDINAGVGTHGAVARQQFIGLEGGFGFAGLGRQYAPGFGFSARMDAFGGATYSPLAMMQGAAGATIAPNGNARWNNSAAYRGTFSGVTIEAIHGFGETNQEDDRRLNDRTGLGLSYANGPVAVGLLYQQVKGGELEAAPFTDFDDQKEWALGGSYDFGAAKVFATYQRIKVDSDKDKVWSVGLGVPVSAAGNFQVSYARLDADNSNWDARVWGLGYVHSMSKRTQLYTAYNRVSNKSNSGVSYAARGVAGENSSGFVMGITHAF